MLNIKLLKGALAAAAALIVVSPALAGPAVPMKFDQTKVELVHSDRGYSRDRYYGNDHYKPSPYAWKHKKRHFFGWRKHRHWGPSYGYGYGYDRPHHHHRNWR